MDKRTLLAFGLIGIIIWLMPYYFRWINPAVEDPFLNEPTEMVRPAERSETLVPADNIQRNTSASIPKAAASQGEPTQSAATAFEARNIIIETDQYIATISTRGGLITSWRRF